MIMARPVLVGLAASALRAVVPPSRIMSTSRYLKAGVTHRHCHCQIPSSVRHIHRAHAPLVENPMSTYARILSPYLISSQIALGRGERMEKGRGRAVSGYMEPRLRWGTYKAEIQQMTAMMVLVAAIPMASMQGRIPATASETNVPRYALIR